jgi:hypothetical protein
MSDIKILTGEMASEISDVYAEFVYCGPSNERMLDIMDITDGALDTRQALALDEAISDGIFTTEEKDYLFTEFEIAPGFLDEIRKNRDDNILMRRLELIKAGPFAYSSGHNMYRLDELIRCACKHPKLQGADSPVRSALLDIAGSIEGYGREYVLASLDRLTGADRSKYTPELAAQIRDAVLSNGLTPQMIAISSSAEYYMYGTALKEEVGILSYSQAQMVFNAFFDPTLVDVIESEYGLPMQFVLSIISVR